MNTTGRSIYFPQSTDKDDYFSKDRWADLCKGTHLLVRTPIQKRQGDKNRDRDGDENGDGNRDGNKDMNRHGDGDENRDKNMDRDGDRKSELVEDEHRD